MRAKRIVVAVAAALAAALAVPTSAERASFAHPGLLHSRADLDRMRRAVAARRSPWVEGWQRLVDNKHSSLTWVPRPQAVVYRGRTPGHAENYAALYNDAAAAYADALRWRVTGDAAYADKAAQILDAWSSTLTAIEGTSDRYLASGIYGYQLANAAEILRGYAGWPFGSFDRFCRMMLSIFYPMNHDFLIRHNGAKIDHYWANWDLANMASMVAIGVLADRHDIYGEAIHYFKHGTGNGAIRHAVWKLYPGGLGQWQESGRDQGHATLGIALMGAICQMAWNQGDDLFGYDDSRLLKGAEYVARYNLGHDVPYTPYANSDVVQPAISAQGRGDIRPIWELVYNHYVRLKHMKAPSVEEYAAKVRPEGGGGDYGPNSGGYDQLGYGTLTFALPGSGTESGHRE